MNIFRTLKDTKVDNEKVNLLIIGAQKCGTTSLHMYLNQHPEINGSIPKEVDYFSYEGYYLKGNKWYHNHFSDYGKDGHKYLLDSSVEYMYIPNTWKRILKYNSEIKIIVLLRDPIDRAFSAYFMYKKLHNGNGYNYYKNHLKGHNSVYRKRMLSVLKSETFLSFEEYCELELKMHKSLLTKFWYEPSFLNRGLYWDQLKPYYENFPRDNILVINSENLKTNKEETVLKILNWLKLDSMDNFSIEKEYLKGEYNRIIPRNLDSELRTFFFNPNERLFKMINADFNWNEK